MKEQPNQTLSILCKRNGFPLPLFSPLFQSISGQRDLGFISISPHLHERARQPKHLVPGGAFAKLHQRQRPETAKLPVSTLPKLPKRRRASARGTPAEAAGSQGAAGRGFLPAGAPGTRTSTGGLQTRALRPGRTGKRRRGGASHGRPPQCAPGTRRQSSTYPALPLPASGARRTVDRYFVISAAHRAGPGDPALSQLRNSALRSAFWAAAFFPSPLSAQAPAQHESRAARLPDSQGSQRRPHP